LGGKDREAVQRLLPRKSKRMTEFIYYEKSKAPEEKKCVNVIPPRHS